LERARGRRTIAPRRDESNMNRGRAPALFHAGGPRYTSRTMSESQGGMGGATSRRCRRCGETFVGAHDDCTGLFKELLGPDPSEPSSIDEMPPEAGQHLADPTRRLNHYILVDEIGKGGMGKVWKAWDTKLTRWAAIKFLNEENLEDIRRFGREAKLAARLRHPNIAAIYEVGEVPPRHPGQSPAPFIAMELIDGPTLAAKGIEKPLREWVEIFVKVAEAVHAAHQAGVVHRDLKPQNIMLNPRGWPYVMDFGLAKSLSGDTTLSGSGVVMGTPAFMPPEQAQGRVDQIDEQSDVYSLGSTLYAILARTAPFSGASNIDVMTQVIFSRPEPPRKHNPQIPIEVETIILKAMAWDKADRFDTAEALAADLRRWLGNQEILARRPGPLAIALRQFRHRPALSSAVLALVLAVAAAACWSLLRPPEENVAVPADRGREELGRFLRNLSTIKSEAQVRALTDSDFEALFALPSASDDPAFPWVSVLRPALDAVRTGKAAARSLLDSAAAAAPLVPAGENGPFKAVEQLAYLDLADLLRRETELAGDETRDKVDARKESARELLERWSGFLQKLPGEFRARHPFVDDHARALGGLAEGFPRPLAELESLRVEDSLASANPEAELKLLEDRLRALTSRPNVSVESRRELWSSIVAAAALREFLAGRTEEDAARALKDEGGTLRRLGGPATKAYGKRVEAVFELILR
jgi:serine/threonine protein kinase